MRQTDLRYGDTSDGLSGSGEVAARSGLDDVVSGTQIGNPAAILRASQAAVNSMTTGHGESQLSTNQKYD